MHREGDPAGVVASVPADALAVAGDGLAVNPAQVVINSVVAITVVVRAHVDELSVNQSVVTIVAQHGVIPDEIEQGHIPQVDDVVGVAVNLVAIIVQVVE